MYGKWKIVSLKIADKTLEEDHLGGKYYEFMPNGDVWVSTKSESTRKKYTRGTDFIYDPENGKRMQIMNISKYEMQIKGEAEDGQYFYLTLRRVKKQ